jgi:protein-S-isoprenylcysteine O-methyltransferase Ste14
MKPKMSILGIGPKLFVVTAIYSVLLILLMKYLWFNLRVEIVSYKVVAGIGVLLVLIGLVFLKISATSLLKAYKSDQLYVKGAYSICRHPLYSAWMLFIIPGILLFFCSWLLLTIPVVMYLAFRVLIREEETYLRDRFGDQYIEYRNCVGLLFPRFRRYKR